MTRKTILNESHRALGAKMVDFGGWDMPLNYGSQIEEHHAVRRDAGMFDVSHMTVVDCKGPRTREFLRHLLANNVDKLKQPGKALYSCMLNEEGGVIDDLIVYFVAEDFFRTVVNASTRDKDLAWINAQAQPSMCRSRERARSRHDRRAGSERARQGGFAVQRGGSRPGAQARQVRRHAGRRPVHRPHRLHRRGRLRDHGRQKRRRSISGIACSPPASSRPGSARATPCASRPA